jgi:L-ribulose-5-phosphate 4-epimerase
LEDDDVRDRYVAQRQAVVDAAGFLVSAGAMSLSHHGNFSVRITDTDTFLLTGAGTFDSMTPDQLALVDLAGNLIDGDLDAANAEIVHMHACVYRERPEAGSVVHTHSPYSTSFAIAGRPIEPVYEALVRFGMSDGVPVARYGPRGSPESIDNIVAALKSRQRICSVLLANHGLLAFGPSPSLAARIVLAMEEAAQMSIGAMALGGPQPIPLDLRDATTERAQRFAERGTIRS